MQGRAHRIGQKRSVLVIRLIARYTVEEIILRRALRKLHMAHAVIERGGFSVGMQDVDDALMPQVQL
jgi:SNF2 family DNA or RNA helicase